MVLLKHDGAGYYAVTTANPVNTVNLDDGWHLPDLNDAERYGVTHVTLGALMCGSISRLRMRAALENVTYGVGEISENRWVVTLEEARAYNALLLTSPRIFKDGATQDRMLEFVQRCKRKRENP